MQKKYPHLKHISSQAQCFVHKGIKLTDAVGYSEDIELETAVQDEFLKIQNQSEVVIEKYDNLDPNSGYTFIVARKQPNGAKFDNAVVSFKTEAFASNSDRVEINSDALQLSGELNYYRYVAYTELKANNVNHLENYFMQTNE